MPTDPEIGEELPGEWGARKLSVPEGGIEMPPVPVAGIFVIIQPPT